MSTFLQTKLWEILRSVCSLCYCLRRPHQHQCQHLCHRRSGSCRCCCTQPRETIASPSFHGAACSSSDNCHCDGGIGADIGAGVNVSDNSTESTHFAGSPTAWPRGSPQRPPAEAMQDAVMGCDLKCCCNLVKPHRNDEVSLDMKV